MYPNNQFIIRWLGLVDMHKMFVFPTAIKLKKKKEDDTVGLKIIYVNTSINLNTICIGSKEVV